MRIFQMDFVLKGSFVEVRDEGDDPPRLTDFQELNLREIEGTNVVYEAVVTRVVELYGGTVIERAEGVAADE